MLATPSQSGAISCQTVSPAASHTCQTCSAPFGKDCSRCGTWRAWKRWRLEKQCAATRTSWFVILCHRDAHIEARLPINEQLEAELEEMEPEMTILEHVGSANDLDPLSLRGDKEWWASLEKEFGPGLIRILQDKEYLFERRLEELEEEYGPGLVEHYNRLRPYDLPQQLLLEERLKVVGSDEQRQHDLRKAIEEREAQFADDSTLDILFEDYIVNLPTNQHPQSKPQQHRMFTEWKVVSRRNWTIGRMSLFGWKTSLLTNG